MHGRRVNSAYAATTGRLGWLTSGGAAADRCPSTATQAVAPTLASASHTAGGDDTPDAYTEAALDDTAVADAATELVVTDGDGHPPPDVGHCDGVRVGRGARKAGRRAVSEVALHLS